MKQLLTFSFLLLTIGLFAQPANDDCAGIIDLGFAPSCDSTLYNNIGATQSDIGFDNFNTCFVGVPDQGRLVSVHCNCRFPQLSHRGDWL
ncbi:MAG: hypothetical protein R2825_07815 [Saprospiraceae bacterium]